MAIINTKLGGTDPSDGQILTAENFTDTINASTNITTQVYGGSGFDSSVIDGTDEDNYEMDSISSDITSSATYIKITVFGNAQTGYIFANGYIQLKIQSKEIGGSYADILAYDYIMKTGMYDDDVNVNINYVYYHTLTAGEKSNGIQLNIFSKSYASAGSSTTFTNKQTIIEVL